MGGQRAAAALIYCGELILSCEFFFALCVGASAATQKRELRCHRQGLEHNVLAREGDNSTVGMLAAFAILLLCAAASCCARHLPHPFCTKISAEFGSMPLRLEPQ